jgi:methionyl-tRNA formyltransferase
MTRAVVFGYHDVGVRCLKVLISHGVDIPLVVTHRNSPGETIWFGSVAQTARDYGIAVIEPDDVNAPEVVERVRECAPQFLFSFYFRQMIKAPLLSLGERGAFNMHGSLLPRYRGRAPVNWAVLKGERETGATLHAMTVKPDDGAIVDQQAVPILPDDTAGEVFAKVTVAAEMVLDRCVPALIAGRAKLRAQDPAQASYFGGRKTEDGRIDWTSAARAIHDLVRAVAPPYPGAFTALGGGTLRILRTFRTPATGREPDPAIGPAFFVADGALYARCADGATLRIAAADFDGEDIGAEAFARRFGDVCTMPTAHADASLRQ